MSTANIVIMSKHVALNAILAIGMAFVIGVLSDGFVMMGVSLFWQNVIKGLVIIAAVVIDQAQQKLQARVAVQAQASVGK